ncbi:MFS transporter [Delftia sp. PS-11]|uniref:MFS transporter n=1 Tax=Delftia sp. PS-11 TaxID=2767222 RepID=UPI002456267D|nr:MFS transporter [Delftia sp. PS-11]KAJ8746460.1 MFS transporter [Delftia sp. PS-11]
MRPETGSVPLQDSGTGVPPAAPAGHFSLRPLLAANLACTLSMMAFVALVGPIARLLGLAPWQAGASVTVGGLLWMLLARVWGAASDRHGRRPVLLAGAAGFALAYWAMVGVIDASLHWRPAPLWVFAGLVLTRGAIGAFYAAVPSVGQALVADHVPSERRAASLAALGAASAVGMVAGPALAATLAPQGLSLPLHATGLLPLLALAVLWRTLPRGPRREGMVSGALALSDPRMRRCMCVAFAAMFSVAVAQSTVGFFALDRLALPPAEAARTAGLALTCVGVALIAVQVMATRLGWTPQRMIRTGALVAAAGGAGMWFVSGAVPLYIAFATMAAGMGWVFPAFQAMAANAVQAHEQGAAAGAIGAAQGLGMVSGPLVGTLLHGLAPVVPYALLALLMGAVALWPARRP